MIEKLQKETAGTRFSFLVKACTEYSDRRGSRAVIILNLQSSKGKAKPYQVEQVISALKRLEDIRDAGESEN